MTPGKIVFDDEAAADLFPGAAPGLPQLVEDRMRIWPHARHFIRRIGPWLSQRAEVDHRDPGIGLIGFAKKIYPIDVFPFGVQRKNSAGQSLYLGSELSIDDLHVID